MEYRRATAMFLIPIATIVPWITLIAVFAIPVNANAGMLAMTGMLIAGVILLRTPSTSASDST